MGTESHLSRSCISKYGRVEGEVAKTFYGNLAARVEKGLACDSRPFDPRIQPDKVKYAFAGSCRRTWFRDSCLRESSHLGEEGGIRLLQVCALSAGLGEFRLHSHLDQ